MLRIRTLPTLDPVAVDARDFRLFHSHALHAVLTGVQAMADAEGLTNVGLAHGTNVLYKIAPGRAAAWAGAVNITSVESDAFCVALISQMDGLITLIGSDALLEDIIRALASAAPAPIASGTSAT